MTNNKLNDLQLVLLSAAAQREDGSLLPPPDHLAEQAGRIRKVIPPLIKRSLVEESPTDDVTKVWREEGEERLALSITQAGRTAIGVDNGMGEADPSPPPSPAPQANMSKTDQVLLLLRRPQGASLEELVIATGWLPHSARAALTGLRKKGHAVTLDKSGDQSVYRLTESGAA
jgi:hypothetical protein